MNQVEIRGLRKQYPSFSLDDVSFDLEAGKITGFIGRNGAGKTTVIKAMLNLIHADSGDVRFFELRLSENEADIKQRVGFSPGTVSWYPRRTIRQIVDITRVFYTDWDEGAYRRYLDLFSLDETKKPIELSEGMKVKFNLLLALSHHAKVLILDEPTSGLDPFSRDELLEVLETLRNEGATIFFSTHITSDLEKCADNIIYIRKGAICAACPKAEFTKLYGQPDETLEQTFLRLERSK